MDRLGELRLLVKIASMYYEEKRNQSDIARNLNLSQSFVSRALKKCQKEGIVKFSVYHPAGTFVALEQELQEKYDTNQIIVVDVEDQASDRAIKRAVGSSAVSYLESTLTGTELIGISSWSTSIAAMVEQMRPNICSAAGVIQILGGVGHNGNLHANILTNTLADLLQCPADFLPSTVVARSQEERESQLQNPEIADVEKRFVDVDLAIVGIGTNEPSQAIHKAGIFHTKKENIELTALGAIGDICLHYYNAEGEPILKEEDDLVISMTLSQIKACSQVVALACGLEKVDAIKGALFGNYVDVLVTDRLTALQLAK